MDEELPSREQALELLRKSGCSRRVVKHCEAVAKLAVEIAKTCQEKGLNVDLKLVEVGALLHDIGRSRTHSVHHAIVGAAIAEALGLPKSVTSIVKRHVGGGITVKEAKKLNWPKDVYVPKTLEEKIVSYADKLIEGSRPIPIKRTVEKLSKELPPQAVNRIWRLHEEISSIIGDREC